MKAKLVSPEYAKSVGLIDELVDTESLFDITMQKISEATRLYSKQQTHTKNILRQNLANTMLRNLAEDTNLIIESWFSQSGQRRLSKLYKKLTQK